MISNLTMIIYKYSKNINWKQSFLQINKNINIRKILIENFVFYKILFIALLYMSSNKILSVLNQQIQNNNNLIKSYEKNLASVELKDGNIFLIYDDFSKINLGKFLDNDNSIYKEVKLVKK